MPRKTERAESVSAPQEAPSQESPSEQATDWAKDVIEEMVAAQKKALELAAEQNTLFSKALEQGISAYRSAPTPAMAEWVRSGIGSLVEVQRQLAEATFRQVARVSDAMKAGDGAVPATQETNPQESAQRLAGLLGQTMSGFFEMQKAWTGFAAQQNAQILAAARQAFGLKGSDTQADALAGWAQKAMESYAEAQKRWLEMVAQLPFGRTPSGGRADK